MTEPGERLLFLLHRLDERGYVLGAVRAGMSNDRRAGWEARLPSDGYQHANDGLVRTTYKVKVGELILIHNFVGLPCRGPLQNND